MRTHINSPSFLTSKWNEKQPIALKEIMNLSEPHWVTYSANFLRLEIFIIRFIYYFHENLVFCVKSNCQIKCGAKKEATYSLLHDYLWPMTSGKLCKVVMVLIFPFGYFDKFDFTSKRKNANEIPQKNLLKNPSSHVFFVDLIDFTG